MSNKNPIDGTGHTALSNDLQKLEGAWEAYQTTHKRGLAFGAVCYDLWTKYAEQGSRDGGGLRPMLDKVGIPHSTFYFWRSRHMEAKGLIELKKERRQHKKVIPFNETRNAAVEMLNLGFKAALKAYPERENILRSGKDWGYSRLMGKVMDATIPVPQTAPVTEKKTHTKYLGNSTLCGKPLTDSVALAVTSKYAVGHPKFDGVPPMQPSRDHHGAAIRSQLSCFCCSLELSWVPSINLLHYPFCPPNRIGDSAHCGWNPCSAVVLRELAGCKDARSNEQTRLRPSSTPAV